MSKQISTKKRTLLFVAFGWVLLILGDRVGDLELYQGSFVATYALAITSIILLTGYSGQLSLGQSALMAVGAYAGALTIFNAGLHPVIGLFMAALVAGIFGLIFLGLGFRFLWAAGGLERLWGSAAFSMVIINWLSSIATIGDHRFRIPTMSLSLVLQVIGFSYLFISKCRRLLGSALELSWPALIWKRKSEPDNLKP